MQKTAQERGRFDRYIREHINKVTEAGKGVFQEEITRLMDLVRSTDDQIRSHLTGKPIGNATTEFTRNSKEVLKSARKNFNRREYMLCAADLDLFDRMMHLVSLQCKKYDYQEGVIHHKFIIPENMDDETLNRLRNYTRQKDAEINNSLIKEAGTLDTLHNLISSRGRGLSMWEKTYSKHPDIKPLKTESAKVLNMAERLFAAVIAQLKLMSTARAVRRPDDFKVCCDKIASLYSNFASEFEPYHKNVIKPWIDKKDKYDAEQKRKQQAGNTALTSEPASESETIKLPSGIGAESIVPRSEISTEQDTSSVSRRNDLSWNTPADSPPPPPAPSPGLRPGPVATEQVLPAGAAAPAASTSPTKEQLKAELAKAKATLSPLRKMPEDTPGRAEAIANVQRLLDLLQVQRVATTSHNNFMSALQSMSGEDPRILASVISKYAKSIQEVQPEAAIKLFTIVKQLKG